MAKKLSRLFKNVAQEMLDLSLQLLVVPPPKGLDLTRARSRSSLGTYMTAPEKSNLDCESGIWMEDAESEPRSTDFVIELPSELLFTILQYIDAGTLINCFLVSRKWHLKLDTPTVWRHLYKQEFREPVLEPPDQLKWSTLYRNRTVLEDNWRQYSIMARTLDGHDDSVYCVEMLSAHTIATGSRDKTIRIWDLRTSSCIGVLTGHTGSVLCLAYDPESQVLVSGSSDCTCKIWGLRTLKHLKTLEPAAWSILDVLITGDSIFASSKDSVVTCWDRKDLRVKWHRNANQSAVNSLEIFDDILFTAGGDSVIKQWDIHTGAPRDRLRGHTRGIACITVMKKEKRLVSGGNDRSIRIWDLQTGECIMTLQGHRHLVRSLHVIGSKILSASYDRTIRVWDAYTGAQIAAYKGWHASWIFCVKSTPSYIVSTSVGRRPVVLDFSTGVDRLLIDCLDF